MNAAKGTRVAIYARVSTSDQTTEQQLTALHEAATASGFVLTRDYIDNGISGSKGRKDRPGLDALMFDAEEGKFDMVMVWALDRAFRSVADAANCMTEWKQLGIHYYDHIHRIDTSTPGGEMVFHIIAAVAQFERTMISERTKAGLARARKAGRVGGRPMVGDERETQVRDMLRQGIGIRHIVNSVGVGFSVVYRIKKAMEDVT